MPKVPSKKASKPRGKAAEEIDIPKELQELKILSRSLFEAKVNELFFVTQGQLARKAADSKASVIDVWIARVIEEAIEKGDMKALQFFLDRMIGPATVQKTIVEGHMSWVQYIEDNGVDDFEEK